MGIFKREKCDTCGRKYSKKEELMNHIQVEHGASKYDCKECGMYFSNMEAMRTHLQKRHSYKS